MKNQITLSEIKNRIFELQNKIHQAHEQAQTEVHTRDGVTMFGTTVNLEDVWSDDEMKEFFNVATNHDSVIGVVAWIDMSKSDCFENLEKYLD